MPFYSQLSDKDLVTALREEVGKVIQRSLEIGLDAGTATGGSDSTIEDTDKDWGVDQFAESYVEITAGTGKGQIRKIVSNTEDTLNIQGTWDTPPSDDSLYSIFGAPATVRSIQNLQERINQFQQDLQEDTGVYTYNLPTLETDIEGILGQLDITLSTLRNNILGVVSDLDLSVDNVASEVASEQPRNMQSWGGIDLTGKDITADPTYPGADSPGAATETLRNLDRPLSDVHRELESIDDDVDLSITGLRDDLQGDPGKTLEQIYDELGETTSNLSASLLNKALDAYHELTLELNGRSTLEILVDGTGEDDYTLKAVMPSVTKTLKTWNNVEDIQETWNVGYPQVLLTQEGTGADGEEMDMILSAAP